MLSEFEEVTPLNHILAFKIFEKKMQSIFAEFPSRQIELIEQWDFVRPKTSTGFPSYDCFFDENHDGLDLNLSGKAMFTRDCFCDVYKKNVFVRREYNVIDAGWRYNYIMPASEYVIPANMNICPPPILARDTNYPMQENYKNVDLQLEMMSAKEEESDDAEKNKETFDNAIFGYF